MSVESGWNSDAEQFLTGVLRVKHVPNLAAWALTHADKIMKMDPKSLFEDRAELVGLLQDEGFSVDHFGYVS